MTDPYPGGLHAIVDNGPAEGTSNDDRSLMRS